MVGTRNGMFFSTGRKENCKLIFYIKESIIVGAFSGYNVIRSTRLFKDFRLKSLKESVMERIDMGMARASTSSAMDFDAAEQRL